VLIVPPLRGKAVRHPQEFGIYGFWIADSLAAELLLSSPIRSMRAIIASRVSEETRGRRQLALFAWPAIHLRAMVSPHRFSLKTFRKGQSATS
jgi:hypothetical protein